MLEYIVRAQRSQTPPGWTLTDTSPTSLSLAESFVPVLPQEVATRVAMLDLTFDVPSGYIPQIGWRLTQDVYWVEVPDGNESTHG